jgi:protein TonB
MFKDALLDSSPRQKSVLRPIHYLLSAIAGTLFFVLGLYLIPLLFVPAGQRALIIAAAIGGIAAAFYTLMVCYVGADGRQQHIRAWPWVGVTAFLNLPGFLVYLVYSAQKTGDWRRVALPLAYVAELTFVGGMILVPLIYTQALPRPLLTTETHIAPPPGRPPTPMGEQHPRPSANHPTVDPFLQPAKIPPTITAINESPDLPSQVGPTMGVIGSQSVGDSTNWVIGSLLINPSAPPPPTAVRTTPRPQLYRQGGDVTAARAVFQPRPVYPRLAIMAHVQGTVVLQAILGNDGTVQDLKVLSGPPLLISAALDAVRTWRYQPTLLNSEPVDVLTEIDVKFSLGE